MRVVTLKAVALSPARASMSPRMFVRFQRQGARLHVRLLQTRRTSGKIRSEYIGALGSVDTVASVRERLAFWAKLPERLLRLGNRVNEDQHAAIYAALHARIPMVTPDEQREIQVENAKDNERFWDIIQEMNASSAEGHKLLIASAEAKRQEHERLAAAAAEKREVARERLAELARGESGAGELGKKLHMTAVAKKAGLTPKEIKTAELTEAEFETFLERHWKAGRKGNDKIYNRELRRVIRERAV